MMHKHIVPYNRREMINVIFHSLILLLISFFGFKTFENRLLTVSELARSIAAMMGMSLFWECHRIGVLDKYHYKKCLLKAFSLY